MAEGAGAGGLEGCGAAIVPPDGALLVRVHVPELNVQKCLQFPRDQLVWDVKQQCLAALPKELKESFNYGLFCPPENGRAGKFLDEERRLGDYPFSSPVGYLELKYKRRVYKMISLDEKQLKSLHTRANLRRFLDYVHNGQVEKITKMCSKGLDPNFHCQDSGETPLTIATSTKKPAKLIIALVNGGALLDYRTRDGSTALHRAVERRSLESLRTLLELGASPNYRDGRGLTPLYISIAGGAEPQFAEALLHDHASTGAKDGQGWQEVHQACKLGLLPQLEQLLYYGADMDSQNASGNTPLHVCAVNGQEACARQLLFRGADRQALNYSNQTPAQVAVIAGNMELAELIENYKQEDVVPFRGPPSYNPRRRSAIGWPSRPNSMIGPPSADHNHLPPSPCPSDRSAPFSSASSSLSGGSDAVGHVHMLVGHSYIRNDAADTASIITEKSLGDGSDAVSDSSGVGTAASSDTNTNCSGAISSQTAQNSPSVTVGSTVVCVEPYQAQAEGHISIREGELIEVTGATDDGHLEGAVRSGGGARVGLFPARCVREVKLRRHDVQGVIARQQAAAATQPQLQRVAGRRESGGFATAPRVGKKVYPPDARTVVLHRGRRGFGFVLRGAKATSPLMEAMAGGGAWPALQYLDDVEAGGVAATAGLRRGDFLLRINGEDVSNASHERVVEMIRGSGDLVQMTVVSWSPPTNQVPPNQGGLPTSHSSILAGSQSETSSPAQSRQYAATLPRRMSGAGGRPAQAPLPPRRDPRTTLSVGRARAKSMVAGLGNEASSHRDIEEPSKSSSAESIQQSATSTPVPPRTASIKQRPTRATHLALENVFAWEGSNKSGRSGQPGSPGQGRVYASVAEMKRSNKSKNAKQKLQELFSGRELRRTFHSTPDLSQESSSAYTQTLPNKSHRSQEDLAALLGVNRTLPPPTHPPPPPPQVVQVVKVDVARTAGGDYDSLSREDDGIISSFKPTTSAKLYASPEDMKSVGYRSKSSLSRPHLRKSQSLRSSSTTGPANAKASFQQQPQMTNPYAQPFRASRSNSTANAKDKRKKMVQSKSTSSVSKLVQGTPPIPEPDYSCTDSEAEFENESKDPSGLAARLSGVQLQPVENSGNSNTSGSSTGSNVTCGSTGSNPAPNFSAEDIRRGRSLLRSSRSYPDDFVERQKGGDEGDRLGEDGDNSSSGVSSDQENHATGIEYADNRVVQDKVGGTAALPTVKNQQRQQSGLLSRHAVSLVQLPPPIEDSDEKEDFCLPPPPEFGENTLALVHPGEEVVVAPPPQFSDGRQVTRVRIVGAVPKSETASHPKSGRLHSQ